MNPFQRTALRAAILIHECHTQRGLPATRIHLPEYAWSNLLRLTRRIERARERGWQAAAQILSGDLPDAFRQLEREVALAVRSTETAARRLNPPLPGEIYADLLAVKAEFGGLDIDLAEQEISVTTDPIVLEDIHLGAFRICLDWQALGHEAQPYRVVALDPNPASRDETVTHPHVQDERLCEGHGRAAIASALAECRLQDFFGLVASLLHNYGRGAAYVELDCWFGLACDGCGAHVDEEDRSCCEACQDMVCSACSGSCAGCDAMCCSGCLRGCASCGDEYCARCLKTCPVCRKPHCADCREDNLCRSCHDKAQEEEPGYDEMDEEINGTERGAAPEPLPAAAR